MSKIHICPFCEEGSTKEVEFSQEIKAGRKSVLVTGLKKRVCTLCQSESVPAALHDQNMDLVEAAQERVKNLVPTAGLRTLRERWDLSQKVASRIFGAGPSSFGKWESGQSSMSTPAALLVKVALRFPLVVPYLAKLAGVRLGDVSVGNTIEHGNYKTVHFDADGFNQTMVLFTEAKSIRTTQESMSGTNLHEKALFILEARESSCVGEVVLDARVLEAA